MGVAKPPSLACQREEPVIPVGTLCVVICPVDAIRWQSQLCDVGLLLDKPPADAAEFEDALRTTVANPRRALPYYEKLRGAGRAFRWWGLVHGWAPEHLEAWWRQVSTVYPFTDAGEGWAFKARPFTSPVATAGLLRFIAHHHIRRAHFLGATSLPVVATLLCLGPQAELEFVSGEYWTHRFIFHNMLTLLRTCSALSTAAAADPDGLLREVLGDKRYWATLRAFDGREPHSVAVGLPRSLLEWVE